MHVSCWLAFSLAQVPQQVHTTLHYLVSFCYLPLTWGCREGAANVLVKQQHSHHLFIFVKWTNQINMYCLFWQRCPLSGREWILASCFISLFHCYFAHIPGTSGLLLFSDYIIYFVFTFHCLNVKSIGLFFFNIQKMVLNFKRDYQFNPLFTIVFRTIHCQ